MIRPSPAATRCTSLQQFVADAVPPQPWHNGGGSTRVLHSGPASAEWLWRVSLADITQDGPFSAFPGVRRWFTVVQGAGVRQGLAAGSVALTPNSSPVAFDGAEAPGCSLLGGATRELNLMLRAPGARACLLVVRPGLAWCGLDELNRRGGTPADPGAGTPSLGWRAVFNARPALLQCTSTGWARKSACHAPAARASTSSTICRVHW